MVNSDRRFPKSHRLLKRPEFKEVFDRGVVRKDARLVAYLLPTGGPAMRLGIVVGRAARSSVPRNRLKRLIREGFRITRPTLPTGVDVILLPRHGAKLTLAGVQESVTRLLSRPITEKLREPATGKDGRSSEKPRAKGKPSDQPKRPGKPKPSRAPATSGTPKPPVESPARSNAHPADEGKPK